MVAIIGDLCDELWTALAEYIKNSKMGKNVSERLSECSTIRRITRNRTGSSGKALINETQKIFNYCESR